MASCLAVSLLFVSWAAFAQCNENAETVTAIFLKWFPFSEKPTDFAPVPGDKDCEAVKGIRFMKPGDSSLIRIEDPHGNFVGTQTVVAVDALKKVVPEDVLPETLAWYDSNPQIEKQKIDGQDVYVMSAYIRDPETICGAAPTEPSTTLYFKHDKGYLQVARQGLDLVNDGWVLNPCFNKMGFHYRYKVEQDENFDCKDWTPIFLLSDGKDITGYGWNFPGKMICDNYEHAPEPDFNLIMKPMPKCVSKQYSDNGGYTSEHFYLTPNPENIVCPQQ